MSGFINYLEIIAIPFLIGAAFHYFGAWVGLPALIVGSAFWIGAIANQYKREAEAIASRDSSGGKG